MRKYFYPRVLIFLCLFMPPILAGLSDTPSGVPRPGDSLLLSTIHWTFEDNALHGWHRVSGNLPTRTATSDDTAQDIHLHIQGTGCLDTGMSDRQVFGDALAGELRSDFFVIDTDYLIFQIGGGDDFDKTYLSLCTVDGDHELKKEVGSNSPGFVECCWDLREHQGKTVYLRLVDQDTGYWGRIFIDNLYGISQRDWSLRKPSIGKLLGREYKGTAYYIYIPESSVRRPAKTHEVLAVVHGADIAAKRYACRFYDAAETEGVVLVSVRFDPKTFPDFNRLGISGARADIRLLEILEDIKYFVPVRTDRFYLCGHSAGAQFAHRFAMVHPERIIRGVASATGNLTFPDDTIPYHYGIRRRGGMDNMELKMEAFVGLEFALIIGDQDDHPYEDVPGGTIQFGKTPLQRAKTWHRAMEQYAKEHNVPFGLKLFIVKEAGHSGEQIAPYAKAFLFLNGRYKKQDSPVGRKTGKPEIRK